MNETWKACELYAACKTLICRTETENNWFSVIFHYSQRAKYALKESQLLVEVGVFNSSLNQSHFWFPSNFPASQREQHCSSVPGFVPVGSLVKNIGSKFYQWTEITDITSSPVCQPAKTREGKKNAKTAPGRVLRAEIWAQGEGNLCWRIWLIWRGIKMSACVGSLFPFAVTEGFRLYCLLCKHRLWRAVSRGALCCSCSCSSLKLEQLTQVARCQSRGDPGMYFHEALPWNLIAVMFLWQPQSSWFLQDKAVLRKAVQESMWSAR